MSQQQTKRNHRHKSHHPKHDAATGSQFVRNPKNVFERRNGRQLRSPADSRQLDQRSHHAGAHQKKNLGLWDFELFGAIGMGDFLVGDRNDGPHQHRNSDKKQEGFLVVNRVQTTPEFANAKSDAMPQVGGHVRETFLNPIRQSFTAAVNRDRSQREHNHQRHEDQANLLKPSVVRQALWGRGKKGSQNQQERETADVENTLHRPYGKLRREGQIVSLRDEIGTDQLSRAAEQSQTREADHGRGHELQYGRIGTDRLQENFPAHRAQHIRNVDQGDAVKDVVLADVMGLSEKQVPVEVPPGTELHVDQRRQHDERDSSQKSALFVHERERPRGGDFYGWRPQSTTQGKRLRGRGQRRAETSRPLSVFSRRQNPSPCSSLKADD